MPREPLLRIEDLYIDFETARGVVRALNGVNLTVERDEAVGLLGESGSGKSATALAILRLLPPNARIVKGGIYFDGVDLLRAHEEFMLQIRGSQISMVFQNPATSLNPIERVGEQILDSLITRQQMRKGEALEKIMGVFALVKMPNPDRVLKLYPFELSGGMQQRVCIAMAVMTNPALLIADEPTTALDVTVQKQIIRLLRELRGRIATSLLFISHNMGVISELCDRVAVMYAGNVVEFGNFGTILQNPAHPYTRGLISSIPSVREKRDFLESMKGSIPDLVNPPSGCRFHPRCPYAMDICPTKMPLVSQLGQDHRVSCYLY